MNGILNFYNLDVEFKGSKNITLYAYPSNSNFLQGIANLSLRVYYSKFNVTFPKSVTSFELIPNSNNETNITVYGQEFRQCNVSVDYYCVHTSTPIYNFTLFAYDKNADLYVRTNQSYNTTQLNFSFDLGVNRTTTLQTNNSYKNLIINQNIMTSRGIFAFVDFYNVSEKVANETYFDFEWRTYCNQCVR